MECFASLYADYYDLMYQNKDYRREVDAVLELVEKHGADEINSIVSLGAGTLNYERILAEKGFNIIGLDISADMVKVAKDKIAKGNLPSIEISQGDMRDFSLPNPADAVFALFNIVSYCSSAEELAAVARSAFKNLKLGGVFVFDCWNAEAVKRNPPASRFSKYDIPGGNLYRLTTVENYSADENKIDLNIELIEAVDGNCRRESELHRLRCWDAGEIRNILTDSGFDGIFIGNFPDISQPITLDFWPIIVIAQKSK